MHHNFVLLLLKVAVTGECCGSESGRQRKNVDRAGCAGTVGDSGLADNGARQVSATNLDPVRFFCLSCHTRTDAFAVRLKGWFLDAGVAQW